MNAEIKVPTAENLELSPILPLKHRVGQSIAMYASPTARNFYLSKFVPPCPFNGIFPKLILFLSCFFPLALSVAIAGCCVGQQNKIGHPPGRNRRLMQIPVLLIIINHADSCPPHRHQSCRFLSSSSSSIMQIPVLLLIINHADSCPPHHHQSCRFLSSSSSSIMQIPVPVSYTHLTLPTRRTV